MRHRDPACGSAEKTCDGAVAASFRIPPHHHGMRIGLFGGTFDPPHGAHRAASLIAMKRLGLERVWWLVTPGNPLKDSRGLAPIRERIAAARTICAPSTAGRTGALSPPWCRSR
jgi:hypothetical protein